MDLIITEKKATICLNMIVKNESHIIENTLVKLCAKIHFDYWVICDTGSTDNTPQIITDFFLKMGIKGELFYDEWVNFSHNRTLALQRAYKKTNLLLVFDADDEIVGNVNIPTEVLFDEYHMKFGSHVGTSYTRVLLINNYKQFEFLSVIHEFISCKEPSSRSSIVDGNYYVISGRSGSRNKDPNKYLNDAIILEKAHAEALQKGDHLYHRYSYYCANSYRDCGRFDDAIKWYKITLSQEKQWPQEKYTACLFIYECYRVLNQEDRGFFYLVKAFNYDNERVECLFPLLVHYCCENMHKVAYYYYLNVKNFFENFYLNADMTKKLFIVSDKFNFFVPYYMILIADKVKDFKCVIKMYEIIFTKKQLMFEGWYVKNLLYNLQFFLQHITTDNTTFITLANDYFKFLLVNGVNIETFDFLHNESYKKAGLNWDSYFITEVNNKPQIFTENDCMNSKNILIYAGFSDIEWNYTHMLHNALGGSEKAVNYLSQCFPKDYNIYISGHVANETVNNVKYVHLNQLETLINTIPFHTVIVSRYISFYEIFGKCSYYQSYIWAHDVVLLPYGCKLNELQILTKWNKYINGCICLTEWHRDLFKERYPILKDKITLINNGLDLKSFNVIDTNKKIKNKFIYSSRPDRGLNVLLNLWPKILEKIPDATLVVSSYGTFPSNAEEEKSKNIIAANDSIKFLGKLNVEQLYNEMETSEYWLYPTHWPETSCITALEMLMSEVICLYYPVAGLINTMDQFGIQIKPNSEIDMLISLTNEQREKLRKNGREYAEKCSWSNRSNIWVNLLFKTNNHIIKQISNQDDNITEKTTEKTIIFATNYALLVMDDYKIGLKEKYNIEVSDRFNYIIETKPTSIIFIGSINKNEYDIIKQQLPNCKINVLNLEPLNLTPRIKGIKDTYSTYNVKIYDYSLSNLQILKDNGIPNVELLPYINTDNEIQYLTALYKNTEKIFDFGILTGCGAPNNSIYELGPKRKKLVEYLLSLGFKVNVIKAWGEERDKELSKCKTILNIHGQLLQCGYWLDSNIFEHLRCDRLLNAGFNILSEDSYCLDKDFIAKYPNLTIINYIDFFNIETYLNLSLSIPNPNTILKKNYCFIHSCNLETVGTNRLEYLIKRIEESKSIDIFEKIYIINIGIPVENNYGSKYELINYNTDPTLYEAPTLNKLQEFSSKNHNCNILYIHTKGIRYNVNDQKENDWIELMLYFLLDKHNDCIQKLNENYDTVGCNYYYKSYNHIPPHFSGNFWWASTNYLKSMNKLDENLRDRGTCEFWLFRNAPLFYTLHNSRIDHYNDIYPKQLYQPITNTTIETNKPDLGFIILRNVISEDSNKYWIECYSCIRKFYPQHKIVILDCNSKKQYIIEKEVTNTTIVYSNNSSYSIAPYLYYLENKSFSQAVILKDTMFFTKYVDFDSDNRFLWQFEHNWDDKESEIDLIKKLDNWQPLLELYLDKTLWKGCFESMSTISHDFLQKIHAKYNLYKISSFINDDRANCCFERVFAVIFIIENGGHKPAVCGDFHWTTVFSTTYTNYFINKLNKTYWLSPITKIFIHELNYQV